MKTNNLISISQTCNDSLTSTSSTNCIITYPWYQPTTSGSTYIYQYGVSSPNYDLQVRKVENGFVVLRQGRELVFQDIKTLTEWMSKELSK